MIFGYLLFYAALLLLLAAITPYLRPSKPRQEIDLPSHFVLQYALAGLGIGLLMTVIPTPAGMRGFLGIALLLNLFQLAPYIRLGRGEPLPGLGKPFKVLQANVLKLNTNPEPLRKLIVDEQPDLIVVAELRENFAEMIYALRDRYPYQMVEPRSDSYGMAVLSKSPLSGQEQLVFDPPNHLAMAFRVVHEGKEIAFLSMHPATPNTNIASRDKEFDAAAAYFGARRGDIVVIGDMNATPYCPALKKLCRALNLKNAREGQGICGTFPVYLPTPFLKLPIDHVLLGENLQAEYFRLGPDIGSDHLPTITGICHMAQI